MESAEGALEAFDVHAAERGRESFHFKICKMPRLR